MNKYRIQITWDEEDQIFIARVPELEGVATHGKSRLEAAKHAEEAINLHLKTLAAMNKPFPQSIAEKNLSGNMSLRMGKDVHETAAIHAAKLGKSINEYIVDLINKDDNKDEFEASLEATKDLIEGIFAERISSVPIPRTELIKKLSAYIVKTAKQPRQISVGMMRVMPSKTISSKRRHK